MDAGTKTTGRGARPNDAASVEARENLARWTKAFSDQVIDNVIYHRNRRKMRNDELRDRLQQLGWTLTDNSLAGILGKKRSAIPVTDVMLFAWALNVPPLYLLFPIHSNARVEVTPVEVQRPVPYVDYAWDAARWFTGEDEDGSPGPTFGKEFDTIDDRRELAEILPRLLEVDEMLANFVNLNHHLLTAAGVGEDQRTSWLRELAFLASEIASSREYLRVAFPELPQPELPPMLQFMNSRESKTPPFPIPTVAGVQMSSRSMQRIVDALEARAAEGGQDPSVTGLSDG